MFTNIFTSVVEKLSGLNPIKTFIKYALDKFLNQLINNQITLEDFKNGCLNLTGIGFNVANVNLKHLISSPYIMHSGSIGNLRIQLPNLSQVVTKSIQIQVNQIFIELKPNKDFYQNFKQRMKQLQQNMVFDQQEAFPEQQLSENNPMDFFKQTLKKILLNIRIKVENVTVKIFMNDPQVEREHEVYYLMAKIPLINVHKNNNLKKGNLNVEEIRLDVEVPQMSVHVIKEEIFTNLKKQQNKSTKKSEQKEQFPIINDPSTILLFGLPEYKNLVIQADKSIPRISLSVITNNKQERRDIKVSVTSSRFQMMLDPMQFKVLDRFVRQIREFKDIFEYIKKELNLGQYGNHQIPSNRRAISSSRFFQSRSQDIFSSICMSIIEPQPSLKSKKNSSIIDSMIKHTPNLQKSVNQFNEQFRKQLKQKNVLQKVSQEMSSQLRVANFKKKVDISVEVKSGTLYMLKQISVDKYLRRWVSFDNKQFQSIGLNQCIPCSYFMLIAKNINLDINENGKMIKLELSSLRLNDVKLTKRKQQKGKNCSSLSRSSLSSMSDEFLDVQSSVEFYKQFAVHTDDCIKQFVLKEDEHYCATQILRISQKPSQTVKSSQFYFYNFMPKSPDFEQSQSVVYKPSLVIFINKQKQTQTIKIQILEVAINFNLQIFKEIHKILIEVYAKENSQYEKMDWHTEIKESLSHRDEKIWKKKSMLQSRYNFGNESLMIEHTINQKPKPTIDIKVHEINLAFYESSNLQCFCNCNKNGLYLEIFSPKMQLKNNTIILTIKRLVTGSIKVKNSHVTQIKAFLNVSSKKSKESSTFFNFIMEKDPQHQLNKIYLVAPECSLNVDEKDIIQSLRLVSQQMKQAHEIYEQFRELKQEIQRQELKSCMSPLKKKSRKPNQISYQTEVQMHISTLYVQVLDVKSLIKEIYVSKSAQILIVKFSTLVIALEQKLQLFLNEMKNQQLCLREFIQKFDKYPGFCKDSSIVLEINQGSNDFINSKQSDNLNNSAIKKAQKFDYRSRNVYFNNLATNNTSVIINITKSSICDQLSTNTNKSKQIMLNSKDKFKFTKKPSQRQSESFCGSRSVILQEEQQKKISINFTQPVYIMANALLRLAEHKNHFMEIVKKLDPLIDNIKMMPFTSPTRKHSADSDIDKLESLSVCMSAGRIFVDIRPTFIENYGQKQEKVGQKQFQNKNRQLIFSSSRSYLQLGWQVIEAQIEKRVNSVKAKGSCGLKYYFLQHQDREIATNPILIRQHELNRLGFIPLFQVSALKFHIISQTNIKQMNLSINSISFQSSLSTLGYLQLHWEHFINHNVHKNLGITVKQQEESFQSLDFDSNNSEDFIKLQQKQFNQSQEEIQDLTSGLQYYRKKAQFKHQLQQNFIQKLFNQPKSDSETKFFIQQLSIRQLKIKIYSGSDFQFVSFQSINESKQSKRNRVNDSQILNYLQVRVDAFSLVARSNSLQKAHLQSMLRIQNLQVNYSSKRQMKNSWLGPKKMQQVIFPVLKSLTTIKVLIETADDRLCIKLNKTPFDVGFTSEILQLVEEFNRVKSRIEKSGWKKIYEKIKSTKEEKIKQENQEQKTLPKFLLIYVPQNRLNIRLIYKNITILSDQSLISSQFMLNQEIRNQEKIQLFIKKWIKNLVLDNIGGLIGGTAINVLSDVIVELLGLGYFFVNMITGN